MKPAGISAVLLRKNLLIKRRQYGATHQCCCGIPLPLALVMEFVMPVMIIGFVSWLKTLTDIDVIVDGWGGDTPTNTRSTECVAGIDYYWNPALTSAWSGATATTRTTDCTPFNELVTVPRPFFSFLSMMHWYDDAKLGLAADREEDVPKLQMMRRWISDNWYPRQRLNNIPHCEDNTLTHYPLRASGFDRHFSHRGCSSYTYYSSSGFAMQRNSGTMSSFADITHVHGSGTTADMLNYIRSPQYGVDAPKYVFAIVFHKIPGDGSPGSVGDWDYSIKLNYTFGSVGGTNFMPVRPLARGISDWYQNLYSWEGYSTIQLLVDRYIINKRAEIRSAPLFAWNPGMLDYAQGENQLGREYLAEPLRYAPTLVQSVPLPLHGYILNTFYEIVKAIFALLFLLMYMYPTFSMIAAFIEEKESRVREGLRMMGVGNGSLILSSYATHALVFLVLNFFLTLASAQSIFGKTTPQVVFWFLNCFAASAISFSYMIHNFFDKARTGAIVGALAFMCCYFVYASTFDFSEGSVKPGGSLSLCLLSPAAFSFGISLLSQYEAASIGARWDNLTVDVGGGIDMLTVFATLIFDTFFYTFMGWYLEQVLPKEFGVRQPYLFPFMKSYWFPAAAAAEGGGGGGCFERRSRLGVMDVLEAPTTLAQPETPNMQHVEGVPPELQAQEATGNCIKIQGLRRTFDTPDGVKVAVAGLNLTIFEGQIFALLGHNGAGKTTTLNMLTGLYEPTAGDALVYNKRLTTELSSIRRFIGVCPQHDVLFDMLTVSEHLKFYGRLKLPSITKEELQHTVEKTLADVGMTEKLNYKSTALSGGQKRKLSLGISLIGDSKVVFLDEPTSGMDPYSRRSTWNSLRANREGRCMILTTHFMDEADLLGDRIAIMAEGELRCVGSSLYLKNRFGAGYTLTICKMKTCNERALINLVKQHVPEAVVVSNVGAECAFKLPLAASGQFADCFRDFDEQNSTLGIEQYGCCITSMEEVFIKVAHDHQNSLQDGASAVVQQVEDVEEGPVPVIDMRKDFGTVADHEGRCAAFCRHFEALFRKRARYGRRDKIAACCTSVFPVVMLLLGLLMLKYSTGLLEQHSLTCDASMFKPYGATDELSVPFNTTRPDLPSRGLGRVSMPVDNGAPPAVGIPIELDTSTADGTVWGVQYSDGMPTHAWRPRADRLPDYDRRHIPANRLHSAVNNAESVLAMSQRLMGQSFENRKGSKVFAAVLGSSLDEGTNVCDLTTRIKNNGIIYGDSSPASLAATCTKVIEAPTGSIVKLRFVDEPALSNYRRDSTVVRVTTGDDNHVLFDSSSGQASRQMHDLYDASFRKVEIVQDPSPTAKDRWSAVITFERACQDQDTNCGNAVLALGQFGLTCTTELGSVDVDTIEIPPQMLQQAESAAGQTITEAQLRSAARGQLQAQLDRFGGAITLAAVCPESCAACDSYTGPANEVDRHFQCTGVELSSMQTVCVQAAANPQEFCSSTCVEATLGPWLRQCDGQREASLAELGFVVGTLLRPVLTLAQQCDPANTSPQTRSDCWHGEFTSARCCDVAWPHDPYLGDTSCWDEGNDFTFSSCCAGVPQENNLAYTILYNGTAKHASPLYSNIITNSLLDHGGSVTTRNHPFPPTASAKALVDSVASLQAVLFILIAFAFVPGGVVVFVVREKEAHHNSKHQQFVSGVKIPSYWLSNYAWDLTQYMAPLTLSMLTVKLVGLRTFNDNGAFFACFVLLFGFGWAIAPFTYCVSNLYSSHTRAQIFTVLFNIFLGMGLMITQYVMSLIPSTQELNESLMPFYRLSPAFCLGHGLWQLSIQDLVHEYLGDDIVNSPLSAGIAGDDAFRLLISGPLYLLLAIAIDYCRSYPSIAMHIVRFTQGSLRKLEDDAVEEDEDVLAEAARVAAITTPDAEADIILVQALRKVYPMGGGSWLKLLLLLVLAAANYVLVVVVLEMSIYLVAVGVGGPLLLLELWSRKSALSQQRRSADSKGKKKPKVAVRSASFGISPGECFGYLGINGAGKTSTMKMLTGDILPTSGQAFLGGMNVLRNQQACRRLIGYCPQFDALLDRLTVKEHLELFARIRGVSRAELGTTVESVTRRMDLTAFSNKLAGTLSGGNKRKLSVGIALIGGPPIVFLDEPTTGVDPVARRFLWNVISNLTAQQSCAVILTTHVMEEVEALCTRVGVMVGGRLRCLGSIQHLKSRFGRGYELQASVRRPTASECEACAASVGGTLDPITAANLVATCERFGQPASLAETVSEANEAGWVIWDALQRLGAVPVPIFTEWLLTESRVGALMGFVHASFSGSAVAERQGNRVEFALGGGGGSDGRAAPPLRVADIFESVEAAKERLAISEYSVSQDSMENIFNSFAGQQEQEAGTAQQQLQRLQAAPVAATTTSNPVAYRDEV